MSLTVENVMTSREFADEGFDRPRWWSKGSFYTTLRTRTQSAALSSDLTATTGSATSGANLSVNEIILHDASTGESSVLVSYTDLIPEGQATPLAIDDYATNSDRTKVLIFTQAQKVWRLRTRGSYWILDLNPSGSVKSLRQLGGGVDSNNLFFATFSPDGSKVAYVRKHINSHDLFVEDVATHEITQLTNDGSDSIINGTFDWVYEEEFHLRHGFRWTARTYSTYHAACVHTSHTVRFSDLPFILLSSNASYNSFNVRVLQMESRRVYYRLLANRPVGGPSRQPCQQYRQLVPQAHPYTIP